MDTTATLPFPLLPALAGGRTAGGPLPLAEATLAMPSDHVLIERVTRGDRDAFTVLYRRYERPIFAFLLRLGSGRALAEEWLQETFTRVWLAAGTHDPGRGAVRPWIYKIALNTARSELARKRHRVAHLSLEETGFELPDGGEPSLTARLDGARQVSAVAAALQELPDYLREVVVLRCSRELSFAEIAEVTGAPMGTIKSRFHRAVAALREAVARRERGSR
jgi:RNA polymerase sigma-70 factor (ECF subfamily)